ncbi:hypothetical protein K144313037_11880 [Clostridium tetani]|uniref:hypothetical protein n=1 Tax=Clostridium tetani TaxID=1513 RepID=UPI00295531AF|nr:hypothetical protein [Clostridium tetani]BDR69776.1 hypothetical protein K144313037_11880 [Clostridium tetani]BDR78316.1 hypothetical protein K154307017_12490 [Clostridium tetani]BEV19412.1 hypothetical protein K154301001_12670 [Clostridium tetani]
MKLKYQYIIESMLNAFGVSSLLYLTFNDFTSIVALIILIICIFCLILIAYLKKQSKWIKVRIKVPNSAIYIIVLFGFLVLRIFKPFITNYIDYITLLIFVGILLTSILEYKIYINNK